MQLLPVFWSFFSYFIDLIQKFVACFKFSSKSNLTFLTPFLFSTAWWTSFTCLGIFCYIFAGMQILVLNFHDTCAVVFAIIYE